MAKIERKIIVYFEVDDNENPEWGIIGFDDTEEALEEFESDIISQIVKMPGGRILDFEVK
jgi:hypothetical protein